MPTPAHKCEKRAHHTVCPSCGRIAPDWCAEDEPEGADNSLIQTGSDLPESVQERAEAEKHQQEALKEVEEVRAKASRGKGSSKAPEAVPEAPSADNTAAA